MITDEETAPPRPWTKRAAISTFSSCASPHSDRGQREERHAGEEDALAADEVAEPPGQQEEAAERDQVGVDDPA